MVVNKILHEKLIEVARKGETIPYGTVMKLVGVKLGNNGAKQIGKMLGDISTVEHKQGHPLLSVVVMTGRKPSKGFFRLTKDLKVQTTQDDDSFFKSELQRTHDFWRTNGQSVAEPKYWLENYWPAYSERSFLGVWFHEGKRFGPEDMKAGDRVIFYETKRNPDHGPAGSETVFAVGTLTNDFQEVPKEHKTRGGRTWQKIRLVNPDIWLRPEDGVPYNVVVERLPKFKGWIRQGVNLTNENFRTLETMLRDRQFTVSKERLPILDSPSSGQTRPEFRTFKPRSVGGYQSSGKQGDPEAKLEAQERANRNHEEIRKALGNFIETKKVKPQDHPYVDLRAILNGTEWFFEVKSSHDGNYLGQIRSGVSQLLEYRHRFGNPDTRLCLVIQMAPPKLDWDMVGYLDAMGIVLCWLGQNGFQVPDRQKVKAEFLN